MNSLERIFNWRVLMVLIAVSIVGYSVYFTNKLAKDIALQETQRIKTYAQAIESISTSSANQDISFQTLIIEQNKENNSIPVILTDAKKNVLDHINISINKAYDEKVYLGKKINEFELLHAPIKVSLTDPQYVYYGESKVLRQLRYFPYILFGVIIVFLSIVFIAFNSANKSLQNRVWVGMSKETAHQLGTPLMSMVGWLEYLRSTGQEQVANEMEKDVDRLKLIAERFSKIGSTPDLKEEDLAARVKNVVAYMQKRSAKQIGISHNLNDNDEILIQLNGPLFDWVIENLIRNSLDAMGNTGSIKILVTNKPAEVILDICDTGKGMTAAVMKKVFKPGFTTKQRGWGLGLSLAKRIVTKYHHGHIFVAKSIINEGTTFRIILDR
jgi:hypothetical protein